MAAWGFPSASSRIPHFCARINEIAQGTLAANSNYAINYTGNVEGVYPSRN